MTLTGAFVGVVAAVGVLLIAAGWRGAELRETRRPAIDMLVPKGAGTRELMRSLARGRSVGLMNDQKFNQGVAAPLNAA